MCQRRFYFFVFFNKREKTEWAFRCKTLNSVLSQNNSKTLSSLNLMLLGMTDPRLKTRTSVLPGLRWSKLKDIPFFEVLIPTWSRPTMLLRRLSFLDISSCGIKRSCEEGTLTWARFFGSGRSPINLRMIHHTVSEAWWKHKRDMIKLY